MINLRLDEAETTDLIILMVEKLLKLKKEFNNSVEKNEKEQIYKIFKEYNRLYAMYVRLVIERENKYGDNKQSIV